MNAWQQLLDSIDSVWPSERYRDVGVVVGCSGGADSVALLRALSELRLPANHAAFSDTREHRAQSASASGFFVVAHYNHRLRGADSDADQSFVADLCNELGVTFEVGAGTGDRRDEQSAREDRYAFFKAVLRRYGARYLALAHSLDDNVETVLYRLMRGTGPAGMTGMACFRSFSNELDGADFVVARPLLQSRRDLIRRALAHRGFKWREDASNASSVYDRNWIRNELLPMIEARFPNAVSAMDRAIDGQRQWAGAIEPIARQWRRETGLSVHPLEFRQTEPGAFHEAVIIEGLRQCWLELNWPLAAMKQTHWKQLVRLLVGLDDDVITLPGTISARRNDGIIRLTRGT